MTERLSWSILRRAVFEASFNDLGSVAAAKYSQG